MNTSTQLTIILGKERNNGKANKNRPLQVEFHHHFLAPGAPLPLPRHDHRLCEILRIVSIVEAD